MLVEDIGEAAQRAVSGEMALKVVAAFQVIEIEKQKSEGMVAAFGAMDFPFQAVHEFPVIG
jgi:hypothetical protein